MPSELRLNNYFQWCYDCDELVETWKFNDYQHAGHPECRNVRSMTLPEFIDQVNKSFKDSTFATQGLGNTTQQTRLRNLAFIYEMISKFGVESGNEKNENFHDHDRPAVGVVHEPENDPDFEDDDIVDEVETFIPSTPSRVNIESAWGSTDNDSFTEMANRLFADGFRTPAVRRSHSHETHDEDDDDEGTPYRI